MTGLNFQKGSLRRTPCEHYGSRPVGDYTPEQVREHASRHDAQNKALAAFKKKDVVNVPGYGNGRVTDVDMRSVWVKFGLANPKPFNPTGLTLVKRPAT